MNLDDLNPEQKEKVAEFKKLPPRKGRPGKEFGPLLTAAASVLKDIGFTNKEIAAELKVHPDTVSKMFQRSRENKSKLDPSDMGKIKDTFALSIADIVNKMLVAANTHEYVNHLASSRNPGLIDAITKLIEKLQLLQGKPSNIMEVRDTAKLVEEKIAELTALEASLQASIILPQTPKGN